jgi:sec-independent protein translocase protein TatC
VIIGIFVIAAILTPPDALSQTLMAVPMWLLYELGVIFARIMTRNRPKPEAEPDAGDA